MCGLGPKRSRRSANHKCHRLQNRILPSLEKEKSEQVVKGGAGNTRKHEESEKKGKQIALKTVDILREEKINVLPQFNSSEPSEQSGLKSHTLLSATHSPCVPHTNCPSGQLWGWTVGAGVVTAGVVMFGVGSSPGPKDGRKHKSTVGRELVHIHIFCYGLIIYLHMGRSSGRKGHQWRCLH